MMTVKLLKKSCCLTQKMGLFILLCVCECLILGDDVVSQFEKEIDGRDEMMDLRR